MFKNAVEVVKRRRTTGRFSVVLMFTMAWLSIGLTASFAELERVGPTSAENGYPTWYQDKTGLVLEFCSPQNQAELDGGWCLLVTGDTTFPENFPDTFADEHFYWAANAEIDLDNGGRARLVLGLEAAFAADQVIPGDQIVFGRARIDIRDLPESGTYTIYHPFGTWVFNNQAAGDRIFHTEDIGITCAPGSFDCALTSGLGPFLLPSGIPGGAELPAIAGPVPGKLYIADPNRIGPVTGSPVNQNFFRIEGPNGFVVETSDFSLMGRIYTGPIPGRVHIERATYSKSQEDIKLDVFVNAHPTTQGRLPANPEPPAVTPVLRYFESACVGNPDGSLGRPAGTAVQMSSNESDYWGQSGPALVPPAVCVEDTTARDATGQVVPAFFERQVSDEVYITEALYDPANGGSLSVKADSSDEDTGLGLSLAGHGDLTNGQIVVSPLAAPPSKVRVLSSIGGLGEAQVITVRGSSGPGGGGGTVVPVAVNDNFTVAEDGGTTDIPILDNDTYDGNPVDPASTIVTITGEPRLGTAAVNADGTIAYTPFADISGTDSLAYSITVNNETSPAASVAINITPVNDAPAAVDDATPAVNGQLLSLNLLANDTDPDGAADLADAVLEGVWPSQLGPNPFVNGVAAGGTVSITPAGAGTFTFSYRARDLAGATSGTAATVTVTVTGSETINVANAEFRIIPRRWRVSGTSSVSANQTVTIAYANGNRANGTSVAGVVIGTATVDATGAWILDIRGVSGDLDPTTLTFPGNNRQLRITSPLGGSVVTTFTVRF